MAKKVIPGVRPGHVVIPPDLLKKFEAETKGGVEFKYIDGKNGLILFPEEILAKLGYGALTKAGLEVVIMPKEGGMIV